MSMTVATFLAKPEKGRVQASAFTWRAGHPSGGRAREAVPEGGSVHRSVTFLCMMYMTFLQSVVWWRLLCSFTRGCGAINLRCVVMYVRRVRRSATPLVYIVVNGVHDIVPTCCSLEVVMVIK